MHSRRKFILGISSAAIVLPATQRISLGQTNDPMRRDIAAFENDTGALQALRDAVHVLRRKDDYGKRPAIDGWQALATNHNFWCFGNPNYEIHFGWWFLPWHRAFLIHIENGLRNAIKEPKLRFPYWDWTTVNTIPKSLSEPTYRKGNVMLPNPLYDATRFGPVGQGQPIDFNDLGVPSKSERDLVSLLTYDSFAGGEPTSQTRKRSGFLEQSPHSYIHVAVASGDRAGNMATGMSPLDPIFYLHHANIDRLWVVWLNQGQGRSNPKSPNWMEHRFALPRTSDFEFKDYKIADLLDSRASEGNYQYDRELLPEQMQVAAAEPAPVTRFPLPQSGFTTRGVPPRAGQSVEVPDNAREALGGVKAHAEGAATLVLEGVPIPDKAMTFRVFAQPEGTQQRTLLGSFSMIPTPSSKEGKIDIVLPITQANRQFLLNNRNISIKAESTSAQAVSITIENFSIEVPR